MHKGSFFLLSLMICVPALAQQAGEQERNKQIARSFFEDVLDRGLFDRCAESHAKDFVARWQPRCDFGGGHRRSKGGAQGVAGPESQRKPDSRGARSRCGVLDCIWYQHPGRNGISGNGQEDQD